MNKIWNGLIVFIVVMLVYIQYGIADQPGYAINMARTEKAVTTNTSYTVLKQGTLWIQTDSLIYINTNGTTPNVGYEGLSAGSSRSYYPIEFTAGQIIKMTAASGTANVVIYNYDM